MNNVELKKENINLKGMLYAFWLCSLSFLLIFLSFKNNGIVSKVFEAIGTTLLTISIIDILYEWKMRREFHEEMSQEIYRTFNKEKEVLKKFTKEAVGELIQTNLQVRLGDERGNVLYEETVKPYIDCSEEIFRTSFNYHINLSELDNDINCNKSGCKGVVFKKDDYHRITEELTFSKKIDLSEKQDKNFKIIIAFDDMGLYPYLPPSDLSKICIYREILRINEPEANECIGYRGDSCVGQIGDDKPINIKVKINNKFLNVKATFKDKVFEILCDSSAVAFSKDEYTDFVIEMQRIHSKAIKYYYAYIVEPSYSPQIQFGWSGTAIKGVTPLAFFTGKNTGDLGIAPSLPTSFKYIEVKSKRKEWIFPRSGVVFVWE